MKTKTLEINEANKKTIREAVYLMAGVADLENGYYLRVYTDKGNYDVGSMGNKYIFIMDEADNIIADMKVNDDEELISWLIDIFEGVLIKSIQMGG